MVFALLSTKSSGHCYSEKAVGSRQAMFASAKNNGKQSKVNARSHLDDSLKLEPQFAMHETTSELARTRQY